MKKRFLLMAIAVMSAVVMICMTSCGGTDANVTDDGDNSADASAGTQIRMLDVEEDPYCVMPGDCDSRGYLGLICDDTEEYVFTAVNSDKTELEWEVYVMDIPMQQDTLKRARLLHLQVTELSSSKKDSISIFTAVPTASHLKTALCRQMHIFRLTVRILMTSV